jgi:hypothetical protein
MAGIAGPRPAGRVGRRPDIRKLLIAAALMAFAAPAFADTLKEVTERGVVMTIAGVGDVDVAYKADGSYTAAKGSVTGKWRINGDRLCTKSNLARVEQCDAYPKDKKSGDTFEVASAQGPIRIRIK